MARSVFVIVILVICAVIVTSRADMGGDQVGHQPRRHPLWNGIKDKDPKSIREKGRLLFSSLRQKSRTMMNMKEQEWRAASLGPEEMEQKKEAMEKGFRHIAVEAEYEIKQRIVDAISGEETPFDPDVPETSREITELFMGALFASTFEEQTSKEDQISKILKGIIDDL